MDPFSCTWRTGDPSGLVVLSRTTTGLLCAPPFHFSCCSHNCHRGFRFAQRSDGAECSLQAVTASNNARPNSPDISGQKKKATSMEALLPPREALQRTLEMRQLLRQQGLLSRGYGSEILTSANVRHATGQEMPFSSDLKIGRPSQTLGPSGWNLLVSTQNIAQSTQGSTDGKRGNVPVMKGSLRPPFTGQYASGVVKK